MNDHPLGLHGKDDIVSASLLLADYLPQVFCPESAQLCLRSTQLSIFSPVGNHSSLYMYICYFCKFLYIINQKKFVFRSVKKINFKNALANLSADICNILKIVTTIY